MTDPKNVSFQEIYIKYVLSYNNNKAANKISSSFGLDPSHPFFLSSLSHDQLLFFFDPASISVFER